MKTRNAIRSALAVLGALLATQPISTVAQAIPIEIPACAWGSELSPRTIGGLNFALPDTAASYWLLPYVVRPGLTLTVTGGFQSARYLSFNTYNSTFGSFTNNGVASALTDYRIDADTGSSNPWQDGSAPGGRYTVTVSSNIAPGQPNTLPLAPAGAATGQPGFLIIRFYLPAGGQSAVELPTVTETLNGESRVVPTCTQPGGNTAANAAFEAVTRAGLPFPGDSSKGFSRLDSTGVVSAFPNIDNAYLRYSIIPPTDDRVLVIRGKAPRTPAGDAPTAWPNPDLDARFYSLCTYPSVLPGPVTRNPLPGNTFDEGCRNDDQTAVDAAGYYTYVVGTESQRARIEQLPGVTFLPFSTEYASRKHDLLLRNMLPNTSFEQAIQNVPANVPPEQAAEIMGEYYPRTTQCALHTLTPTGCPA